MALRFTPIGEEVQTDEGTQWFLDREEAETYAADLIGTLLQFGGQVSIVAERVKVDEVMGEDVMQTRRLLCFYNTSAPLAGNETAAEPASQGA